MVNVIFTSFSKKNISELSDPDLLLSYLGISQTDPPGFVPSMYNRYRSSSPGNPLHPKSHLLFFIFITSVILLYVNKNMHTHPISIHRTQTKAQRLCWTLVHLGIMDKRENIESMNLCWIKNIYPTQHKINATTSISLFW